MIVSVYIKTFNDLSKLELYEILKLRSAVFVLEQKCAYQDIDGLDIDAVHLTFKDNDELKAYLRIVKKSESCAQIGRVIAAERRKGYATKLIKAAVEYLQNLEDITSIYLEAQTYAISLYKKLGFEVISDEFLEDGIPHVKMMMEI